MTDVGASNPPEVHSRETIANFLGNKNSDFRCVFCASEGFSVVSENNNSGAAGVLRAPTTIRAYGLVCANCGLIYSFADSVVNEWIEANPKAAAGE